jgi:hypothetical protein
MTKKIYYEKVGRRYVPVAEYDNDLMDSFRKGNHLVMCYPGGVSRRFDIDPNYAAMIAAGRVAEDAVSKKIMEATEIRRQRDCGPDGKGKPLTPSQRAAWDTLVKEFGPDARQLEWPSAREAAEAAVQAMQAEADSLLQNPAVKRAYERFQFICNLTREVQNDSN